MCIAYMIKVNENLQTAQDFKRPGYPYAHCFEQHLAVYIVLHWLCLRMAAAFGEDELWG